MTRVLQVMAGAAHGGAEAFFARMVLALAEAGLDQRIVMRPGDRREQALEKAGLTVATAPFRPVLDLTTRVAIRSQLRQFDPAVTLTWMSRAAQLCPHPGRGRILAARLGGFYHLKYFSHCDLLVGNTHYLVDWLAENGWPREKLFYLPNFVDVAPSTPIDRAGLNTRDDVPVILALGRYHDDKAYDVLLPALAQIPEAVLWIAGEGPREARLKAQAQALSIDKRIRWLGWRKDVPALAAAANLLCCPSRVEPLGNVVLEAWAMGLPIVAAAASGPAELIRDGETGLLVPVENADALAAAIRRLIDEPALGQDLAARASVEVAAKFSRAQVVAAWMEFFAATERLCAA